MKHDEKLLDELCARDYEIEVLGPHGQDTHPQYQFTARLPAWAPCLITGHGASPEAAVADLKRKKRAGFRHSILVGYPIPAQ